MNYKIKQLVEGKIEFTASLDEFNIDEIVINNKEQAQYTLIKSENVNDIFMTGYKKENGDDFVLSEFEKSIGEQNIKEKSIVIKLK